MLELLLILMLIGGGLLALVALPLMLIGVVLKFLLAVLVLPFRLLLGVGTVVGKALFVLLLVILVPLAIVAFPILLLFLGMALIVRLFSSPAPAV